MGVIISKFRKKKTTLEVLESLETQIKEIEHYQHNTELQRKRIVGHLILFSVGLYVIAALLFYFFFFPATLYDQLFYITPLLIFPIIILLVKRLLSWYYNRKIRHNQTKLATMKMEKKKILDKVMDTEIYKVAKGILEKFAPDQLRKSPSNNSSEITPLKLQNLSSTQLSNLRTRAASNINASPSVTSVVATSKSQTQGNIHQLTYMRTPLPYNQSMAYKMPISTSGFTQSVIGTPISSKQTAPTVQFSAMPPTIPMPRTILPRDRSVLDKMVEYLVGDGPANRFALICKNCHSHNGMALREEFEYISFRCCYCYNFNPSRKLRPSAPKLESDRQKSLEIKNLSSSSESEANSPSDSDNGEEVTEMNTDKQEQTSKQEVADLSSVQSFTEKSGTEINETKINQGEEYVDKVVEHEENAVEHEEKAVEHEEKLEEEKKND